MDWPQLRNSDTRHELINVMSMQPQEDIGKHETERVELIRV